MSNAPILISASLTAAAALQSIANNTASNSVKLQSYGPVCS